MLSKIREAFSMENFTNATFLRGTCNNSTWREDLISQLDGKVDFFNPVVPDWTPECQAAEDQARADSRYVLFVITSQMTGVFSIAEAVDCSNKRPESTLFCYLPDGFDKHQEKSLAATARMIERNGGTVFGTLQDVASFLNSVYN